MSENIIYQILELATVVFEAFIIQQYIASFFDRSIKARKVFLGYFLFCIGLSIFSLYCRQPILLAGYTLLGVFAITYFFYNGNLLPKLFSSLFFSILMISSEIVCVGVISRWGDISLINIHEYGLHRALYIVTAKITQIFIVKILGMCIKWRVNTLDKIEVNGAFLLIACQFFSIILSNNVFMEAYNTQKNLTLTELLSILAIMYINLFVFWYFDRIKSAYEYKHDKELAEAKLEFQKKYYELLEERQQETESLWHDMKKHMITIKELYESGLKSDTEQYIDTLDNRIASIPKVIRTSAPIINVILMDEIRKAKKENIEIRLDINVSQTLKINAYDLCILLGNIIENAIEANSLLSEKHERYIVITILQDGSLLLIDVKNPFDKSNKAILRKTGKRGYGLRNVHKVVKKYGGDIEIKEINNTYHVSIILP